MSPRDITGRILGRPLRSRYGHGASGPSAVRWLLLAGAAWLVYATFFSDHSLWRIATLRHQLTVTDAEVRRVRAETTKLESRLTDPRERAAHAEEMLRGQGMARQGEIIYRLGAGADSSKR